MQRTAEWGEDQMGFSLFCAHRAIWALPSLCG